MPISGKEIGRKKLRDLTILLYVDHTSRFERNTGIQRCVRCLSRALQDLEIAIQPVVWNREGKCLEPASIIQREHLALWNGPKTNNWHDADPSQPIGLVKAHWLIIAELVSGPYNPSAEEIAVEADKHSLKVAWLFHDAIPLHWAHLYGKSTAASSHARYMRDLAHFDLILANSKTSELQLRRFWHEQHIQPCAKLRSVPLAEELPGTERLQPTENTHLLNLVLCVGSLEPRKNHQALLKAFIYLVAHQKWPKRLTLVLVGWPNSQHVVRQVIRALSLGLPLRWEDNADDDRLLELYKSSLACIYPSLEEGFGLPVAESLWHSRPCLCSNKGALAELAAQGGCITVDTQCWKALKEGIDKLVNQTEVHAALVREIKLRPQRHWKDVAKEWIYFMEINS